MIYHVFPKGREFAVVLSRSTFRDQQRIDLREHVFSRPGNLDTLIPTKAGVSIPVAQLPALRAALQDAERELLDLGVLRPVHYSKAGLQPPAADHVSAREGSGSQPEAAPRLHLQGCRTPEQGEIL